MRLTIISPLFPPGTAPSAIYVKVLMGTLVSPANQITGVVYGQIPESVSGVPIIAIPKRQATGWRLVRMLRAIYTQSATTDIFIICNGPSIEVPFWFAQLFMRTPYIFIINDSQAEKAVHRSWWKNKIHENLIIKALGILNIGSDILKYCPPEIHPLLPFPDEALNKFKALWETHRAEILHQAYVKQ